MKKKELKNNIPYKAYRKLHHWFWNGLKPGKWSLYLYSSYWHYKVSRYSKKSGGMNELYLTLEPNRGAGIGHQMGNWLAGYCLAEKFGVKYAYSRFPSADWDDFLGFGEHEISTKELILCGYTKKRLPGFNSDNEEDMKRIAGIINSYQGKKVIFYLSLDQYYRNIQEAERFVKEKFNNAKSRHNDKIIYERDTLNIAIHIRRGDIVAGQTTLAPELTKRWMTNDYYATLLKEVVSCIPKDRKYQIYLFSQGTREDFPEFDTIKNVKLCFDMPTRDSFLHMIRADILITSKSSFSYKPALLSDGIKICPEEFWHGYPADERWLLIDVEQGISQGQKGILNNLLQ